jgi:tetratricopeptide (TPR) repeat protein
VELDPTSSSALIALSYAQQARFDLEGALESLQKAVRVQPADALAWARLADIELSHGRLGKALDAARQSVTLDPELAHAQMVLGFAYLTQIRIQDSKEAFQKAIRLAPADPMPRLGLGLALIRDGELEEGRREIEIAAILDPERSLIRSYLGKAFFEEKRDKQAAEQLSSAKELDPLDPTPWYYDAIRKQTVNRPVEGLEDLQESMRLNDNRAVYRSRLLLDEDIAARSASLARIYDDLGFQWLALSEGWKSLNADPSNYSAHRFLADSYFSLPRHDIARVSALLQSQLLQPLNIRPVQPQLAESRVAFAGGVGPRDPSYNEYSTLFERNRLSLLVSGAAGERGTFADEVVQSGVLGRFSYSLGQLHSETDGFRQNNNRRADIYDGFLQVSLTPRTSAQVEYRRLDSHLGDVFAAFDPTFFGRNTHEEHSNDTFRFGLHHSFSPESDLIGSFFYKSSDDDFFLRPFTSAFPIDILFDSTGYGVELQHIYRTKRFSLIAGAGHFDTSNDQEFAFFGQSFPSENKTPHSNGYIYSLINFPDCVTWTLGLSIDDFSEGSFDLNITQVNPKFGVTWEPLPGTTLRGAAFRTLKRTLLTNQTVEPTQVAGFNQFFDDGEGSDAWRYGIGWDQKFTNQLYGGAEFSWRNLEVPAIDVSPDITIIERGVREKLGRAYLYWTPHRWFSLGPEYQYEELKNPEDLQLNRMLEATTHRVALGMGFYHPTGFITRLRPAFVAQHGVFLNPARQDEYADSEFFVVDASIGYRLPKRFGLIEIEARNLFDDGFRFQDTDPQNPRITPGRLIVGKWTFNF